MAYQNLSGMYMSNAPLQKALTREEERDLAYKYRAQRLALWEVLFSFPPALREIVDALNAKSDTTDHLAKSEDVKLNRKSLNQLLRTPENKRARTNAAHATSLYHHSTEIAIRLREQMGGGGNPKFNDFLKDFDRELQNVLQTRNLWIEKNIRLVIIISQRYYSMDLSQADLVQEGIFGLTRALERFDPDKGFKFSTYSSWWIRHAIGMAIRNSGKLIRVSSGVYETYDRYRAAIMTIQEEGRPVTDEELSKITGLGKRRIQTLHAFSAMRIRSFDTPLVTTDDNDATLGDLIADKNNVFEDFETKKDLDCIIEILMNSGKKKGLSQRQLDILRRRFIHDETLQEIGNEIGVSRERVRQIENDALSKIQDML